MGVSTLHQHFRALTSMSPLQYQKKFRLHSARERMSMDGLDPSSKPWRTSTSFTPLCGRNLRRARCTKLRSELLLRRSGREIPFPAPALRDVRRLESETREAFRFLDLASRRSLLLRTRICQMHARSGFLVADPPLLFVRRNVKFIHPMRNCITNYVLCENISPIRTKNYALT